MWSVRRQAQAGAAQEFPRRGAFHGRWRRATRLGVTAAVLIALVLVFGGWQMSTHSALADTRSSKLLPVKTSGYAVVNTAGVVATFGGAGFHGDVTTTSRNAIVAIAVTHDADGYWLTSSTGKVLAFGDAESYGSSHDTSPSDPIVAMAVTDDGRGYWLVAKDGQVFAFGDAASYATSVDQAVNGSVVAIAAAHDGMGYWLVTSTGDVLSFGDAVSYGSADDPSSSSPIVAMVVTNDDKGYWLVASSGQILTFGDAISYAPSTDQTIAGSITAMAVTSNGEGYVLVASDGAVYTFGDATDDGSDVNPAEPPSEPADFSDRDPAAVGVAFLASGQQLSTSGAVRITYYGDSTAWLDEIYSTTEARRYDESVADAATPGCGIAGDAELATSRDGDIEPVAACSAWYQRLGQSLASEHPDVVVIELGYWESQPHLWNGTWATLSDDSSYAAAISANLTSAVKLIKSYGAAPVILTSPYYGDGTANADVDAWNSIVKVVAGSSDVTELDLNALLDPSGSYSSSVDGIEARTSDGVHLTSDGVTELIDPWLLPIIETLGLSVQ